MIKHHPLHDLKISAKDADKITALKKEHEKASNRLSELIKLRNEGEMTDEEIFEYETLSAKLFSDQKNTFANQVNEIIKEYL